MRLHFSLSVFLTYTVMFLILLVVGLMGYFLLIVDDKKNTSELKTTSSSKIVDIGNVGKKRYINNNVDSVIDITGTLKKIENQKNDSIFIINVTKNDQTPEILIHMGNENTLISDIQRKDKNSDEVHTAKKIGEITNFYANHLNQTITITILVNTLAQSDDNDCNDTCEQFLNIFKNYQSANSAFYEDFEKGTLKIDYNLGSPVEISLQ